MGDRWRSLSTEEAKALRDERLGLVGCGCAPCSTIAGMEFGLEGRQLRSGRKDNPVRHYLSMRAFAIDRIAGGGMGSFAFEGYLTIIALVMRLAMLPQGPQDYDDSYVPDVRIDAMNIADENGIGPGLGYGLDMEAIGEYVGANAG